MTTTNSKIEIEIRGGMVAAVRTSPDVGDVGYAVVDYDTDGTDDEDTDVDASGDRYTTDGAIATVEDFVAAA